MNLLKIFTYSGIIEVFVVPHILPCIVALIPSHITDMIELGVGIISGLFPRVNVNIESEVFLRVWKDTEDIPESTLSLKSSKNGDNEASSSNQSTDSPTDNGSSSEGCGRLGESKPTESQVKDAGQCFKPKPKDSNGCEFKRSGGNSDSTSSKLAKQTVDKKDTGATKPTMPPQVQYPSNCCYVCKFEGSVSSSTDKMDTFCRSCSVEYQVKPPSEETRKQYSSETLVAKPCPGCETEERNNTEQTNPPFYKSCSVEYVAKLKALDKKPGTEEETKMSTISSEKLVHQSLLKSPLDFKHTFADRQIPPFEFKHAKNLDWKQAGFFEKRDNNILETRNNLVKPVYFGDNYENL